MTNEYLRKIFSLFQQYVHDYNALYDRELYTCYCFQEEYPSILVKSGALYVCPFYGLEIGNEFFNSNYEFIGEFNKELFDKYYPDYKLSNVKNGEWNIYSLGIDSGESERMFVYGRKSGIDENYLNERKFVKYEKLKTVKSGLFTVFDYDYFYEFIRGSVFDEHKFECGSVMATEESIEYLMKDKRHIPLDDGSSGINFQGGRSLCLYYDNKSTSACVKKNDEDEIIEFILYDVHFDSSLKL